MKARLGGEGICWLVYRVVGLLRVVEFSRILVEMTGLSVRKWCDVM